MHIPDGYLSPVTVVGTYAAVIPLWKMAVHKVSKNLSQNILGRVAMAAAMVFVVQMFNIPLVGGTTGHAVGAAGVAIVLGPWAAVLAVTVALLAQALLFGDGGITTLGANVLTMGIVAPFTAHWIYRLFGRAAAVRRWAAAAAGYVSANTAALVVALLLGLQTLFSGGGRYLYAPFTTATTVPVIMTAHLAFLGFVEAVVSVGFVAVLGKGVAARQGLNSEALEMIEGK